MLTLTHYPILIIGLTEENNHGACSYGRSGDRNVRTILGDVVDVADIIKHLVFFILAKPAFNDD